MHDPRAGRRSADVVYTDVWAAWARSTKPAAKTRVRPVQVNQELLKAAGPDAILFHCLPAHRGEEVTAEVLDGPRSRVIPQAANRLHFQKALLMWLMLEPSR